MRKVGDLLSEFLNEQFDSASLENGRITAGLFSSWTVALRAAKIPAAADHSRIRELEHKVLVIEAEHPGWVQLLQTKQSQLLSYVQWKFPELEIQGISFCLSRELISPLPIPAEASFNPENVLPVNEPNVETPENKETNKALYEPIKEFRRVIQKRNRG